MKKFLFTLLSLSLCASAYSLDVDSWSVPNNFQLSTGPSQALVGFTDHPQEFYYWSVNSFNRGLFAVGWPDNSAVPPSNDPNQLNLVIRSGEIKHHGSHSHCKRASADLNDPVTAIVVEPNQFIGNVATMVNPGIKDNVVTIATLRDRDIPLLDPNQRQLWRAASFDGGETFPLVSRIFGLPDLFVDTLGIADDFGNIWISYLTGPNTNTQFIPRSVIIAVSSDGGISFTQVVELTPPDNYIFGYDIPTLAFGGDGQGGKGLWFAPTLGGVNGITPTLGFIPVAGLGLYDVGNIKTVIYTSLTAFDWEPSITVSKKGEVFLASVESTALTQSANDGIKFLSKPDGINNFVDGNYVGPTIIQQRFIGAYMNPPFLPTGTFITLSPQGIVYNDKCDLLYVLFPDLLGPGSPNYAVYLIVSEDKGLTWSDRLLVSDSTQGPRGFQSSLALDKKSKGDLFASWWDARNDPTAQTIEMFGALIPACKIKRHCSNSHSHSHSHSHSDSQ